MSRILLICCLLVCQSIHATEKPVRTNVIRLATSTSVVNSGLYNHILPYFLEHHPYVIQLSVVGSGRALRMGRTGEADVLLVHSPDAEEKFMEDGYGIDRQEVMRNDFVLAGPANDPGNISSSTDIFDAFGRIAAQENLFVSRGDDSGTNRKEIFIWQKTGFDPYGTDWYLEIGGDMETSLEVAQQKNAYLLIERATFIAHKNSNFRIILEDMPNLTNPYHVILVNPEKNKNINMEGAGALSKWLISREGQSVIDQFRHDNLPLYFINESPTVQ